MPAATKPAPHPLDSVLLPIQHRPDRRLARPRQDSGPAAVDAAQEPLSGQDLSDQSELRRYRRAEMLSVDIGCRPADRPRHRHHPGPRGARRARAMRRRRRQERGDHLVGICRGGRRQHRDAGRHRGAGQKDRHADFRSQCGRVLQRSPARRGDLQPHGRRQAGPGGPRRDASAAPPSSRRAAASALP